MKNTIKLLPLAPRYLKDTSSNYLQSGPYLPLESNVKIQAYYYWQHAGKPNGRDLEFYYKAWNFLFELTNKNQDKYTEVIFKLRGIR